MKKIILKTIYTLIVLCSSTTLFAAAEGSVRGKGVDDYLAYFLAMGTAAAAGTVAQSFVISKALEGIARNPTASDKLLIPMILGLALIESLIIFTFVSVFMVQ